MQIIRSLVKPLPPALVNTIMKTKINFMKMKLFIPGLILSLLLIGVASSAQTKTPNIHERQERQQARIAHGVKSGQLTARETEHLEAREAKIQHDKKMAKADGKVTHAERAKLEREENHASQAIYRQKHDAQHR
jgi:hypothetical protein